MSGWAEQFMKNIKCSVFSLVWLGNTAFEISTRHCYGSLQSDPLGNSNNHPEAKVKMFENQAGFYQKLAYCISKQNSGTKLVAVKFHFQFQRGITLIINSIERMMAENFNIFDFRLKLEEMTIIDGIDNEMTNLEFM